MVNRQASRTARTSSYHQLANLEQSLLNLLRLLHMFWKYWRIEWCDGASLDHHLSCPHQPLPNWSRHTCHAGTRMEHFSREYIVATTANRFRLLTGTLAQKRSELVIPISLMISEVSLFFMFDSVYHSTTHPAQWLHKSMLSIPCRACSLISLSSTELSASNLCCQKCHLLVLKPGSRIPTSRANSPTPVSLP